MSSSTVESPLALYSAKTRVGILSYGFICSFTFWQNTKPEVTPQCLKTCLPHERTDYRVSSNKRPGGILFFLQKAMTRLVLNHNNHLTMKINK